MATTWTVAVDWERKGNFSGANDTITSWVQTLDWSLGMRQAYHDVAKDAMLRVQVRNEDKRFSPENPASPLNGLLAPHRPIRIQSNDGTTTRTHFIGWIENIQPSVNQFGERIAEITASDYLVFFRQAQTKLKLQEQARTDDIIKQLVAEVAIPPSLVSGFWRLGVPGMSELGVNTYLTGSPAYSILEQGVLTLTLAGDNWVKNGGSSDREDTFDVFRAIEDVTAAERGRFFINRDGKAVFWNRNHLNGVGTPAATFDNSMQDVSYAYADNALFQNEIVVACHPRTISPTANEILWELKSPVTIPSSGSRTIRAKYEDSSGNRIGGRNVRVESVTFSSGTGSVSINPQANSAEINVSGSAGAVLATCVLKGEKITDFGRMEAIAQDGNSILKYGRRTFNLNLPALSDFEHAQSVAEYELDKRSLPKGNLSQMKLVSHGKNGGGHHANQLALSVGDMIRVKEEQTEHDGRYYIIGESHRLSHQATLLETTWYLEPALPPILTRYAERNVDSEINLKCNTDSPVNDKLAQSFKITSASSIGSVKVWLRKIGNPSGNLTVKIYTNSSGNPGSLVTNGTSQTLAASKLSSLYDYFEFKFSTPPSLSANTTYWLVLETTGSASSANYVRWGTDKSTPSYADGELKVYASSVWSVANRDAFFQVLAA